MPSSSARSFRQAALPFAWLCAILPAQSPFASHPPALPADRIEGAKAVTLEQCREWVYALASPELEGRKTGTEGYLKAANYVAEHFADLGLQARASDGSYFQNVPWSAASLLPERCFVTFRKDDEEVLRIPADRLAGYVRAPLAAAGDVMLLVVTPPARPEGSGNRRNFRMPEIPGLAELDVAGKVVLAYIKPSADMADPMTRFAISRGLADKAPAAILFAQDEAPAGGLVGRTGRGRSQRQPADVTIGGGDLQRVLAAGGVDSAVLQGDRLNPAIALSASVDLAVEERQAPAMNVWAVLPGSDPALKDEYVVIGSHLDHIGMRGGLNPGADDDASGTAGVMAIAKMLVANGTAPRRSVLFVCFAGEEDGLVGSRFFAENPPVPLSAMTALLQLDMIGRDEESRSEKAEDNRDSLHLVGTQKLAPALHELCLAKNETAGFSIEYDQEGMFGASDHASLARYGVPVAFFFTGLHLDYHRTTDTPDKIHYEKMLRVTTYVYDVAFELAQRPDRPRVDPDLWDNLRGKRGLEPAAPLLPGK